MAANTVESYALTRVSFRKNRWGMTSARWHYRGVTLHYRESTKRSAPWHCLVYGANDYHRAIANTKADMVASVDRMLDEFNYQVSEGKLHEANS